MAQPKLIEIDPTWVEEFEFAVTGATELEGGEELQPQDGVEVILTGDVVGVRVEKRKRRIKGTDDYDEYWVRKVIVKADTGAKVRKLAERVREEP